VRGFVASMQLVLALLISSRKAKLVIEIDGDVHADPKQAIYDAERTNWLNEQKQYHVIRF
jgi:very-short-patch-repair endonuclease